MRVSRLAEGEARAHQVTGATVAEPSTIEVAVERVHGAWSVAPERDVLAVEEPLEIQLHFEVAGRLVRRTVSVTMRTPGDDAELALGFLFTEGILRDRAQLAGVRHWGPPVGALRVHNVIAVQLAADATVDLERLQRHFYTTSSCGVCGKTAIEALYATTRYTIPPGEPVIDAALVHRLPRALRDAQAVFERTGGLHASALFDAGGRLHILREDVGRHNALDKVIGARFLAGTLPAHDHILLVSGRASFELVQKAVMAGIPVLAAVGAPSSLAVELAARSGMTLLGFVRDDRFNVYTGAERVLGAATAPREVSGE
ncbi:MAG TPA: formate dehydrogenase accessory sulfurtransferase FdhD [Gemmatimonadaceae bacterium]|nr:formate dehydrogenase accessory sulfurtransferase FdhD [Gemmatimonadaceae bacterium]